MELKLYNTLTGTKEVLRPLDWHNPAVPEAERQARMYVCGPTVYDHAHIGNARPLIVFDLLFRLLRHLYGPEHVTYVRNITDVDDKINARAAERGISIRDLTEETYRDLREDVAALGCLPPSFEPRATEFVAPRSDGRLDMITMIARLIAKGNAYRAGEHVLFDVRSMPDYGRLSHRALDEMIAGARVEVAPYKRNPMDFVLWKPSREGEPGWNSPWGFGRPGWHIECSAMSAAYLGETFDIHGGGIDLVFPHHENEIAQSRCAFHTPIMAQIWMHNGFLQVEGEKMSKSLGNVVTIRDLLRTQRFGGRSWPGEVLRLAMLRTHYTQPIDWTVRALKEAETIFSSWVQSVGRLDHWDFDPVPDARLTEALSNDLDTPTAIAVMHEAAREADASALAAESFAGSLLFLGLIPRVKSIGAYAAAAQEHLRAAQKYAGTVTPHERLQLTKNDFDFGRLNALIESRLAARAAKSWQESDRIRDEIGAMGIALRDNKDGTTTWEPAR